MIITYDISVFQRELQILFQDGYEHYKDEILEVLDDAYKRWNRPDLLLEDYDREYAENACCEEYMIDALETAGYTWIEEWASVNYGEGDIYGILR